jgi:flavin-dependent dehydrogenase
MDLECDALVIGAGAAGTASAILLAQAQWRVVLVEQHDFPRRKVCGECIAAGNLPLLDALGVGTAFRRAAGPEIRRVGWMDARSAVSADMPRCTSGPYAYGRALGRDRLDALLLGRARSLGVLVLQPAKVRSVRGEAGRFRCTVESAAAVSHSGDGGMRTSQFPHTIPVVDSAAAARFADGGPRSRTIGARVVIDAHGSWERGPEFADSADRDGGRAPHRDSDLLAFKANFRNTSLEPGFLPVLALRGGYGGMVVGDDGRTTLACCIRRDALAECRAVAPGAPAGTAVEGFLRRACAGVRDVLQGAERDGAWLSVGPLRPGIRVDAVHEVFRSAFRVGNSAGESHPLIGEGISMALQASALLTATLIRQPAAAITGGRAADLHHAYAAAWRRAFAARLRLAALYAHIAMRPVLAGPARMLLRRWPSLLGHGARLAGKAHPAQPSTLAEIA